MFDFGDSKQTVQYNKRKNTKWSLIGDHLALATCTSQQAMIVYFQHI